MIKAGLLPGQGKRMRTGSYRRRAKNSNPWIVLVVFSVLVMIAMLAFLALFINYPAISVTSIPSFEVSNVTAAETQTVVVSPSSTASPEISGRAPQYYIVKQDDTLSAIASQFGVGVDALKSANGLTSDLIPVGLQLVIPTANASEPTSAFLSPTAAAMPHGLLRYQVLLGDTLGSIAAEHGLTVGSLRDANAMVGDTLLAGQFITLPVTESIPRPAWKFSIIDGDIIQNYPLTFPSDRFNLHYQPETFPAQDPAALAQLELNSLGYLESRTGLVLDKKYDVFVAGTNFAPPNKTLRGRGASVLLQTFFLHDGTGNPADQDYIVTHELTHLFLWNTIGSPSSTMLSEGAAVYFGMEKISDSEHMPLKSFCAAYLQAGALPHISDPTLSFLGHILDLQNYYAAGCFVKYLIESYGIESFKQVYHSGDYAGVYGKNITDLENEWRISLVGIPMPNELNPAELVGSVSKLEGIYENFFSRFSGNPSQLDEYRQLDQARIALLQGQLAQVKQFLEGFE